MDWLDRYISELSQTYTAFTHPSDPFPRNKSRAAFHMLADGDAASRVLFEQYVREARQQEIDNPGPDGGYMLWTPGRFGSNLTHWLREYDHVIDENTNTVIGWGSMFKQSTLTQKPVVTNWNSRPALLFDGKDLEGNAEKDQLITDYGYSPFLAPGQEFPQQLGGITIAVAMKAMIDLDDEVVKYPFAGRGSLFGHYNHSINSHMPWQGGQAIFDVHENNLPTGAVRERITSSDRLLESDQESRDCVVVMRYDTSNESKDGVGISISVNGVKNKADLKSDPIVPFTLEVDARAVIGSKGWTNRATIGEVVYINKAITEQERLNVEGYLAHKWKFADGLVEGHPYRGGAPKIPN